MPRELFWMEAKLYWPAVVCMVLFRHEQIWLKYYVILPATVPHNRGKVDRDRVRGSGKLFCRLSTPDQVSFSFDSVSNHVLSSVCQDACRRACMSKRTKPCCAVHRLTFSFGAVRFGLALLMIPRLFNVPVVFFVLATENKLIIR
jgi:hypothetical protein